MKRDIKPESYHKTVYDINYMKLVENGIRYAIFDVDCTLLPFDEINLTEKNISLFEYIKDIGIKPALCSSGIKKRVKPVGEALGVNYMYSAKKPYVSFKEIQSLFNESFAPRNSIFIGDSLYLDMYLASRLHMNKIMVDMIIDGFNFKVYPNEIIQAVMFKKIRKYGVEYKKYYKGDIER